MAALRLLVRIGPVVYEADLVVVDRQVGEDARGIRGTIDKLELGGLLIPRQLQVHHRRDMIIQDDVPYVLELNTLPGHTKGSIFPKGVKGVGINYKEMLERIIQASLKVQRK